MFGQEWDDCVVDGVAKLTCLPIVLSNVVNFALIASGVVALFFIIWSGARYITSGGDQKRVEGARKTLTWAIIGLILILISFLIVNIVSALTGVTCIQTIGFGNCT